MTRARVGAFVQQATERIRAAGPACVYSLNLADFKRRNGHVGHAAGDDDIRELEQHLAGLGAAALVARVGGGRWLLLTPERARLDVEASSPASPAPPRA